MLKICLFLLKENLEYFFNVLIFIVLLSCAFGFFQVVSGSGFMPGTDARSTMTDGSFRANGFFFDPNYFALTLCSVWPLLFIFPGKRGWIFISTFLICSALLLTLSRAAMVVLIFQICLIVIYGFNFSINSISKIISIIFISFCSIFISIYLNLFGIGDRVLTIFSYFINNEFSDNSFAERFDLLQAGWRMFIKNWATGVGFGGFEYYSPDYMIFEPRNVVAHNTFLTIASEQGILGFLIFSTIFLGIISKYNKENRKFIIASIIGLCGNMFFLVAHYMPFIYAFLAIISSYSKFLVSGQKKKGLPI